MFIISSLSWAKCLTKFFTQNLEYLQHINAIICDSSESSRDIYVRLVRNGWIARSDDNAIGILIWIILAGICNQICRKSIIQASKWKRLVLMYVYWRFIPCQWKIGICKPPYREYFRTIYFDAMQSNEVDYTNNINSSIVSSNNNKLLIQLNKWSNRFNN